MVSMLRPRVREERPHPCQPSGCQVVEHEPSIGFDHAHVCEAAFGDARQQISDPRCVHVAREDDNVGILLGKLHNSLRRPEPDIQDEWLESGDYWIRLQRFQGEQRAPRAGKGSPLTIRLTSPAVLRRRRQALHREFTWPFAIAGRPTRSISSVPL
jgi:hypothetical protein